MRNDRSNRMRYIESQQHRSMQSLGRGLMLLGAALLTALVIQMICNLIGYAWEPKGAIVAISVIAVLALLYAGTRYWALSREMSQVIKSELDDQDRNA